MNKTTIFYSWQTDTSTKENKFFIKSALEEAIHELKDELKIEDSERLDIELDHDTKNLPGTPPIVDAILSKIQACGIFIADLTYVAHVPNKHGVSNPNVLTERGYALSAIGHSRMIAVMNEAYGTADILPFDLKGLRWPIRYTLHANADKETRSIQKKYLISEFKKAVIAILENCVITTERFDPINFLQENIHKPHEIIKIHGIVTNAVDTACQQLKSEIFSLSDREITNKKSWDRVNEYEKILEPLVKIIIFGCYWGDHATLNIWEEAIHQVGTVPMHKKNEFNTYWENLGLFPVLLLFYAGGIAALKNKKYETLFVLFSLSIKIESEYYQKPIINISPVCLPLVKQEGWFTIRHYGSKHLHSVLRQPLQQYIRTEKEYSHFFGLFELIYNLIFIHQRKKENGNQHIFCDLNFPSLKSHNAIQDFITEIKHFKNEHWLIKAGFFDGSFDNIIQALAIINKMISNAHAVDVFN